MMIRRIGLAALMAVALSACTIVPNTGTAVDMGAHPSMTVSDAKLANIANPQDVAFMQSMIAHHEQAIAMANQALLQGDRNEVRTFAASVLETQRVEVAQMRAWLRDWYPTTPAAAAMAPMPAIAADASRSFDMRFLDAMIAHHEEGIALAKQADGKVEHQQVETLIKSIIVQQTNEVERMRGWQTAWTT